MTARRAQMAGYALALVLTFGVGILVGQQFCADEPVPPPEPECPPRPPPEIIEVCPPEEPPDEVEEAAPVEPKPRDPPPDGDELPDSSPPDTARNRQRLLGWARDQSSTLQGCPRDRGHTYRLAIRLELDDQGDVSGVTIDSDDREPAPELDACLRERIERWTLPDELEPTHRELMFRLTL